MVIGAGDGDDVLLKKMLILYQQKKDGTTETIVCDRVSYTSPDGYWPSLIVGMGEADEETCRSSLTMSVSNLEIIYGEVRRVVREY